jgi:P-type Ca2+ transporter type 2C
VLMPVHILFLELIIDPACSTIFEAEAEEADVMRRPPRDAKEPLFSRKNILYSVLQGSVVLAVVLAIFALARSRGLSDAEARAQAYTTLIIANLGLILTNRSRTRTIFATLRTPNTALWWVLGGAASFLSLVLTVPFLREVFRFAPLSPLDIALCLSAGVFSILGFELLKGRKSRRASMPPG